MNSLPRMLGTGMLVVLAMLVALLVASAPNGPRSGAAAGAFTTTLSGAGDAQGAGNVPPARVVVLTRRLELGLALAALALGVILVFSLSLRPTRSVDTSQP